jgi:hypothetical protein
MATTTLVSWPEALDLLEAELETLEAALASGHVLDLPADPWTPPQVLTRIPQHLVLRAVDLLTRQDVVLAQLHDSVAEARAELAYVASVDDDHTERPAPAFFDAAL